MIILKKRFRYLILVFSPLVVYPLNAEVMTVLTGDETPSLLSEHLDIEHISPRAETPSKQTRHSHLYIPPAPMRSTPGIRTTKLATRSLGNGNPIVTLLVPEHDALTLSDQPVLYWHIDKTTRKPVVLTLTDPDVVEPLLEKPLVAPVSAGIHSFRLADHTLHLQSGKTYEWSVRLVNDPNDHSGDAVARSFLKRVVQNPTISNLREQTDLFVRARSYAQNGIWHDALALLSTNSQSTLAQDKLRRARNLLLKEVGLLKILRVSRTNTNVAAKM